MIGLALGVSAATVLVVMLVAFAVSQRVGKYDIVDTVWGLGFAVVAVVCLAVTGGAWWIAALTVAWGVRLAVHLHRRNHGKPEDRRYQALQAKATGDPRWFMLRRVFLLQGAVMWFVSLPVQIGIAQDHPFGITSYLGVALWAVGFTFETVGDWQLTRFTANPANRGTVLDTGLWRYTRHPNYFGDACVWWGLYLAACGTWAGAATVLSPLLMTFLLAKGSGKPLTERHLSKSRPGYAAYVARTSGFIPLPPKKERT